MIGRQLASTVVEQSFAFSLRGISIVNPAEPYPLNALENVFVRNVPLQADIRSTTDDVSSFITRERLFASKYCSSSFIGTYDHTDPSVAYFPKDRHFISLDNFYAAIAANFICWSLSAVDHFKLYAEMSANTEVVYRRSVYISECSQLRPSHFMLVVQSSLGEFYRSPCIPDCREQADCTDYSQYNRRQRQPDHCLGAACHGLLSFQVLSLIFAKLSILCLLNRLDALLQHLELCWNCRVGGGTRSREANCNGDQSRDVAQLKHASALGHATAFVQ